MPLSKLKATGHINDTRKALLTYTEQKNGTLVIFKKGKLLRNKAQKVEMCFNFQYEFSLKRHL